MDLKTNNTYIDSYLFTDKETQEKSIYILEEATKSLWTFQENSMPAIKEKIYNQNLLYIQLPQ